LRHFVIPLNLQCIAIESIHGGGLECLLNETIQAEDKLGDEAAKFAKLCSV